MLAASPCKKIRPELSAVVYFCGGLPSPHTPGSESRCASAPRKKGGSLSGAPPTLPIREAGGFPGGASCKVLHALRAAKRLTQNSFADHVQYTRMRQYRCINRYCTAIPPRARLTTPCIPCTSPPIANPCIPPRFAHKPSSWPWVGSNDLRERLEISCSRPQPDRPAAAREMCVIMRS